MAGEAGGGAGATLSRAARRDLETLGLVGPMLRIGEIARRTVAAARTVPGVRAAGLHLRDSVTGTVRTVLLDPPEAEVPPPPADLEGVAEVGGGAAVAVGGFAEFAGVVTVSLDRLDEAARAGLADLGRQAAEAVSTAIQFDYFFQRARSSFLVAESAKALIEDFPRLVEVEDRLPRLLAKAAELVGPFLELDGLALVVSAAGAMPAASHVLGEGTATHPAVEKALAGEVVRDATGPALALPMRVGDRVVGAAAVWRAAPLAAHELLTLHTIVSHVGIAASNAMLLAELERLAITDGLTRLYNHRHFRERLRHEVARAKRYNQPMAVLMMDLDDFKCINDSYGHPTGDRLLEEVSALLVRCLRETDLLARYGGEEFAAVLPSTDSEGAAAAAGRVLDAVRRYAFAVGDRVIPVTISIGIACLPEDGLEAKELVEAADRALYAAKRAGKNVWKVTERLPL